MNTYLTIMVTVLVISQIIRVIQNMISLRMSEKQIKENIAWIKDRDITKDDFDVQREVFYLLYQKLKGEEE